MPEKSTSQTRFPNPELEMGKSVVNKFRVRPKCRWQSQAFCKLLCGLIVMGVQSFSLNDFCFPNSAIQATAYGQTKDDQVAQLIHQLDSNNFEEREAAAIELARIGEPAIRPLALKSFHCSPETCWRIKKTLEKICTSGTESVFYKATGILQLRFDTGTVEMSQRLSLLKAQWKRQRKKEAVARLRNLGAKVVDPWEHLNQGDNVNQAQHWVAAGGGLVIVNGQVLELETDGSSNVIQKPKKKLSDSQQRSKIKELLQADLKEARKIVLGDEKKKTERPSPSSNEEMLLRQALFAPAGFAAPSQGVTVELGENWKGNSRELEDLAEISKLTQLTLKQQKFNAQSIAILAAIPTLSNLVFEECQVDSVAIKKASWANTLTQIEFGKLKMDKDLIECFNSIPSVQRMTFRDCNFDGAGFNALKKLSNLRGLQFQDSKIPKKLFEVVAELKQLSYVNFATCQFKTQDYKVLKSKRSNLQLSYTAKAFLGVQGPMELTGASADVPCVVAQVIAGSGAEKGGLKTNDRIDSVNGEAVTVFEDLRLQIAQRYPGEILNLEVNRSGTKVKLKVELTGRLVD